MVEKGLFNVGLFRESLKIFGEKQEKWFVDMQKSNKCKWEGVDPHFSHASSLIEETRFLMVKN